MALDVTSDPSGPNGAVTQAEQTPQQEHLPRPAFPPFTPRDGRYLGQGGRWWFELRVDFAGSGLISADLHAESAGGRLVRVSGRTRPGAPIDSGVGRWTATWRLDDGTTSGGWLALDPVADVPDAVVIRAHVESAAEPGPGQASSTTSVETLVGEATRVGDLLRPLGLEIEVEDGVRPPAAIMVDGERIDAATCLRRSGFDVRSVGLTSVVPRPKGGRWHGLDILDQLNKTIHGTAQTQTAVSDWTAHLLLLSRSDRDGLLGVMPDFADGLPRQGAAVFVDAIRDRAEGADQKIIQTIVHELGHVLNLTHRFATGQWNSASFMNYDWWFGGGLQEMAYQQTFGWSFDADELEHLRHGFRPDVIPGGAAFGSNEYWARDPGAGDDLGGGLTLWLTPGNERDRDGAVTVTAGQPVFLGVSLLNRGGRSVVLPRHALDLKAGQLTIAIEPVTRTQDPPKRFTPVLRRCFDIGAPKLLRPLLIQLGAGQSMHENANLAFGSDGVPFPEPGTYRLVPRLVVPTGGLDGGTVVEVIGAELTLVVKAARLGRVDLAAELSGHQRGLSLAIGGVPKAGDAAAALSELRERLPDQNPLTASIDRVFGLHAGRAQPADPARLRDSGSAALSDPANPDELDGAAGLLEAALANRGAQFDPHTTEHTHRLAAGYRARASRIKAAAGGNPTVIDLGSPSVVVDLSADDGTGTTVGGRVAGLLWVGSRAGGRFVLAPAEALPVSTMTAGKPVTATVTVAGPDGVSERMPAGAVVLLGRDDGGAPVVARLQLPSGVPGDLSWPVGPDRTERIPAGSSFWKLLQAQGSAPTDPTRFADEKALAWWAAAVDGSIAALAEPIRASIPVQVALTEAHRVTDFDDVAGWRCTVFGICGEDGPELTPPPTVGRHSSKAARMRASKSSSSSAPPSGTSEAG